MDVVWQLRIAFSHQRTFLWSVVILASFSVRTDLAGVSSFVRSHWLVPSCYRGLLRAFHSKAVDLGCLRRTWSAVTLRIFSPFLVRCGDRIVLIADGLKNPKEGRKMPGVKLCHQESSNNSKSEFVMAHSCQVVCLLVRAIGVAFAVPLAVGIHEGVIFSNRDKRTLLDKMTGLIADLEISLPFVLVADAYYASRKIVSALRDIGNHLICRVRSNTVAFEPAPPPKKKRRGRPRLYGKKIALKSLFDDIDAFASVPSPVYGEKDVTILCRTVDLLWRPLRQLVRFVLVIHPTRGNWILLSTDTTLGPVPVIELYGMRFKIEVAFKQAVHLIGAFAYHFWMKAMKRLKRGAGTQYLHRTTSTYREQVRRKLFAYELHMQLGLIAQGILMYLAVRFPRKIWAAFPSWMRTMCPEKSPSERIVAMTLQERLPEYLRALPSGDVLRKFLEGKIDWTRCPAYQLAAAETS